MDTYDCDFHIHSKYSGGSSQDMLLPEIARASELKGLDLVGTSDATHPLWLEHIRKSLSPEGDGVYSIKGFKTKFIITTEVEDNARVHHVLIFPSVESAEKFRGLIEKSSVDIGFEGRPHVNLSGEQLAGFAKESAALIGPSHAFTPWTAIYKEYNAIAECYGEHIDAVKFVELGLSADSDMADRISELKDFVFITNSDCHSPQPHRLGREFNRIMLESLSFEEIVKSFERKNGRKFVLNVGLNPREGKYHLTACSRCFMKFKIEDALKLKRRCPECKGMIKKGVVDRINELASYDGPKHPTHRPPYIHALPLAEVISLSLGVKTVTSNKIQVLWKKFVEKFGTEINVLIDSPVEDVKKIDLNVGSIIERFRKDRLVYVAGGGGQYGRPSLSGEKDVFYGSGQRNLGDF